LLLVHRALVFIVCSQFLVSVSDLRLQSRNGTHGRASDPLAARQPQTGERTD
jgi:hypothetical protein